VNPLKICILALAAAGSIQAAEIKLEGRVLFLGDSITHAGQFVSVIETRLRQDGADPLPELINLGLPSETCTGLSEPDHPFPRPNVHERIDRALTMVNPDIVFACYGMNDGIYYPFSEDRFKAYQAGIEKIIEKVKAADAKLILMTPPPFDPVPLREKGKLLPAGAEKYAWFEIYEDYDSVLAKYSEWILTLRENENEDVDLVIDTRTPVLKAVVEARKTDPAFTLSNDGVHLNEQGHRIMAGGILSALGFENEAEVVRDSVFQKVNARQQLLHSAWLSHVGHKRPQTKAGPSLDEAVVKAAEIEIEIKKALEAN
jgi:lysophospholipase L1-like esterase